METETSSEAVFLKLLQKNAFDPLTFLLELEITQAKVTDLATATVNDLQQLLNGLTTNPAQGKCGRFEPKICKKNIAHFKNTIFLSNFDGGGRGCIGGAIGETQIWQVFHFAFRDPPINFFFKKR